MAISKGSGSSKPRRTSVPQTRSPIPNTQTPRPAMPGHGDVGKPMMNPAAGGLMKGGKGKK